MIASELGKIQNPTVLAFDSVSPTFLGQRKFFPCGTGSRLFELPKDESLQFVSFFAVIILARLLFFDLKVTRKPHDSGGRCLEPR